MKICRVQISKRMIQPFNYEMHDLGEIQHTAPSIIKVLETPKPIENMLSVNICTQDSGVNPLFSLQFHF